MGPTLKSTLYNTTWFIQGGDVYSYDEDDMVVDTQLAKHLAHFGIDMMQCQQTGTRQNLHNLSYIYFSLETVFYVD